MIGARAREYCGRDAVVKPTSHDGNDGYLLTVSRQSTRDILSILIADSEELFKRLEREGVRQGTTASQTINPGDIIHESEPKVAMGYETDSRGRGPANVAAQLRPHDRSAIVEIPVRRQPSPVKQQHSARYDTSNRKRHWPEAEMDILTELSIRSVDYDDPCPISWAELDHGTYGKFDNIISLGCIRAMSRGLGPVGKRMQVQYQGGATRAGVLISLDLEWPGGKARDVVFIVEDNDEHTFRVVLGKTIIDKYDLLRSKLRAEKALDGQNHAYVHVHAEKVIDAAFRPRIQQYLDATSTVKHDTSEKTPGQSAPPFKVSRCSFDIWFTRLTNVEEISRLHFCCRLRRWRMKNQLLGTAQRTYLCKKS